MTSAAATGLAEHRKQAPLVVVAMVLGDVRG